MCVLTVQVFVFEALQQRIKYRYLLSCFPPSFVVPCKLDVPLLALWVGRHHFPRRYGPIMDPLDAFLGLTNVDVYFQITGFVSAMGKACDYEKLPLIHTGTTSGAGHSKYVFSIPTGRRRYLRATSTTSVSSSAMGGIFQCSSSVPLW